MVEIINTTSKCCLEVLLKMRLSLQTTELTFSKKHCRIEWDKCICDMSTIYNYTFHPDARTLLLVISMAIGSDDGTPRLGMRQVGKN